MDKHCPQILSCVLFGIVGYAFYPMSQSSYKPLRDASGHLQGFLVQGSSGVTVTNVQGQHTGYIDKDGKTRDQRYGFLAFEPRFDLVSPVSRKPST